MKETDTSLPSKTAPLTDQAAEKRPRGFSVRTRILLTFVLFTCLALTLLWLLQVVFLDGIYRSIKLSQLESSADRVIAAADGADLYAQAEGIAREGDLSILLYYPETGNLTRLSSDTFTGTIGRELTAEDCRKLATLAEEAGGTYLLSEELGSTLFPHRPQAEPNNGTPPVPDGMPKPDEPNGAIPDNAAPNADTAREMPESVIYTVLFEAEEGVPAALILRTVITPLSAARETLFFVLLIVSVVLILLAILLAIFISRTVVRPIEEINRGAYRLAAGDYSHRFPETGSYREAGELAATLNHASAELSKVEDLRRELIANVSHDLRTPLTLISGYSEIMRDLPGEVTPENLQTIIDESARLTSLVNDLLEISKIQSGNLTPAPFPFSFSDMLRESVSTYETLATCRGYHFTLQIDGEATVEGDRAMLIRALNNLINNALTYTGDDRSVLIRQVTSAARVRVEVTDTGAGIPRDQLHDIWDRYYKVDAQHKRAAVGTGLGLSIVKSIVSLHGGSWGVRSSNGYGSTFWFELDRTIDKPSQI
ncbi:MAG: HAMP domain-containing histidine kinase [Clostridia bacterium]|nr:HAMP domain-containing histidine kinase [Clostridia bacterium]